MGVPGRLARPAPTQRGSKGASGEAAEQGADAGCPGDDGGRAGAAVEAQERKETPRGTAAQPTSALPQASSRTRVTGEPPHTARSQQAHAAGIHSARVPVSAGPCGPGPSVLLAPPNRASWTRVPAAPLTMLAADTWPGDVGPSAERELGTVKRPPSPKKTFSLSKRKAGSIAGWHHCWAPWRGKPPVGKGVSPRRGGAHAGGVFLLESEPCLGPSGRAGPWPLCQRRQSAPVNHGKRHQMKTLQSYPYYFSVSPIYSGSRRDI